MQIALCYLIALQSFSSFVSFIPIYDQQGQIF